MFKVFKVILFVCLLHTFCNGQTYFNNEYKTGYHNYFTTNIIEQHDSSFVAFNYVQDSASGRQDLALLKIDKNGNELITKQFSFLNSNYLAYQNGLRHFIPATPSSFFASGGTYTSTTGTKILSKINRQTLDTIKNVYFEDNIFSFYLNNFIKIHDNKYYLIGNKSSPNGQWPIIIHLDSNLTITHSITVGNPINIACNNAVINPLTKKIVFSGSVNFSSTHKNIGLIETDTLGVISNTLIVPFVGRQFANLKYSAFDNSYVLSGERETSLYAQWYRKRLNLTKIDASSFTVLWSKTYANSSLYTGLSASYINSDGSIVTCGAYSDSTSLPLMNQDINGVILKTNANGDSLWMRQYNHFVTGPSPSQYHEIFFNLDGTLDGGYIVCGNVINRPQDRARIMKIDSMGCVISGCGGIITEVEKQENLSAWEVTVYPNPANDFIVLKTGNNNGEEYLVQITDITGKTLLRQKYFKDEKVSLSEFNSGIYLVNLYIDDHLVSTKKLAVIK